MDMHKLFQTFRAFINGIASSLAVPKLELFERFRLSAHIPKKSYKLKSGTTISKMAVIWQKATYISVGNQQAKIMRLLIKYKQ